MYFLLSLVFLVYLSIPNGKFPAQKDTSLRSNEPADIESELRRGYYVDGTRSSVITYYRKEFEQLNFFGNKIHVPSLRLNYPPEEAQTIIRDQTRGTYLEEIVHPLRQSIFINGFEPKRDNDMIFVNGRKYDQKIIVKQFNSNVFARLAIGIMAAGFLYLQILFWINLCKEFRKIVYAKKN